MKRKTFTHDRESVLAGVLVSDQIGITQHMTPEGYLMCVGVPLARTGTMLYGDGEVPVAAGPDGIARVTRGPDELFSPETIASFNGKPVVNDHPDDDVSPENFHKLVIGVTLNPRRGLGTDADLLIGDLMITTTEGIKAVKSNKREISLGYDADYEDHGNGHGAQTSIIGNHVALVDRGRCGPRCAIGDQDPFFIDLEESDMKTRDNASRGGVQPRQQRRTISADVIRKLTKDLEGLLDDSGDDTSKGEDNPDPISTSGQGDIHIHIGGQAAGPTNGMKSTAKGMGSQGSAMTEDEPDFGGDDGVGGDAVDPGEGAGATGSEERLAALESSVLELKDSMQQIIDKLQGGGTGTGGAQDDIDGDMDPDGGDMGDDGGDMDPDDTQDSDVDEEDDTPIKGKTGDSAALANSFQRLIADSEVLVPGMKHRTFDAKLPRKRTVDFMCQMRRRVLDHLRSTGDGSNLLDSVNVDGVNYDRASCAEVGTLFAAAAGAKRAINNAASTKDAGAVPRYGQTPGKNGPKTLQEIAEANAKFWADTANPQS